MDFNQFFQQLKDGAVQIAQQEATQYVEDVKKGGLDFLDTSKDYLDKWTKQLAAGTIDKEDFEFLVKGLTWDVAEMEALKNAGMSAVRIERIQDALIDLILKAAFSAIP